MNTHFFFLGGGHSGCNSGIKGAALKKHLGIAGLKMSP